ncbi:NADPH-dependent assimilatory sulfite reductase flavoprotein subunit [Serratia microhaemolytica]|uniref:NADPH-dependent assimilatory sulfite reductase flavoprotein subunit n=1 Tax=Serratia microhaemolytica TaxID=2675110 RepID=UPI000FDD54F0|nr:NADPH-dependent assimilatory sulfite reductase flavoprotein subunit [Serratia microhaemolytica]
MTTQTSTPLLPLTAEQLASLQAVIAHYSPTQLAWLSGYLWALANPNAQGSATAAVPANAQPESITILSASQTGNARRLAEQLRDVLSAAQLPVKLVNAGEYKFKQIAQERWLVLVTSTQGEGEPPEEAVALHKFLHSKKAPSLVTLHFAVFGLGDSSYPKFCQAGKEFDDRLAELGAQRLLPRVDADLDYQPQAETWRGQLLDQLKQQVSHSAPVNLPTSANLLAASQHYTRQQPLHAQLALKQKITGRNSIKDVRHIEIDLAQSGLRYQPGDALGVWFENDPHLIDELLQLVGLSGDEQIELSGNSFVLRQALSCQLELTQNTVPIVEKYAALSQHPTLLNLLADKHQLQRYAAQTPIVDMVYQQPMKLTAQQLVGLLRPLTPRLYSIASSQAENEHEVHITVGVVRYQIDGRQRSGAASGFLADRLHEGEMLRIFIEHNDHFRLPVNPQSPVIMIAAGTGIAPFRAFMQQREAEGAGGKNWLLFGNPHFSEDFLYQVEWQRYVKQGLLTHIDLAWSRDQPHKVYVQDKLQQQGARLWQWLQQGAHIYVCGDAKQMAKQIETTLLALIAQYGGMSQELAEEFLNELRVARRYQRDVY